MTFASILIADAWGMHGDVGTGWWIVMVVFMVAFWGAVILGGAYLVRGAVGGTRTHAVTARDILDRRFAEGELTAEEYRERRQELSRPADQAGPPAAAQPGSGG